MTKEEAIRFLNEQKEFLLKGCFWEETRMNTNEAFDMAIKALEADVPETNVGKWIPVSEKLPEKEDVYFVTDDAGGMATVALDVFSHYEDGSPYWLYSQNVIAWMLTPEPFKENEE